ncbi:hypothetical protein LTR84_011451 [Exophiala bonariae]|uniref:Dienelactone hydrolase domain-containing protein n=1 Tax=Exophiala bonariae TaxID=1690606 RepID=A0AAV9MUR2_9EURO|nr:hypothetical protein LTR84_011451 [Exophiala bonariae]
MSECCKSGYKWHGQPVGKESTISGKKTYVNGSNDDVAISLVADIFGWTLTNATVLADHFAKDLNATVYVPDFFDGEVISPEMLEDPEKAKSFTIMVWFGRHNKAKRGPEIIAVTEELHSKYEKVGVLGFCYGGWAVFQLAGRDKNLVDCISTAHRSALDRA